MIFFLEREDGMRDCGVRGVHACALPIAAGGRRRGGRGSPPVLIPPLGEPRPQPELAVTEETLPNGLRLVVVPRPGVPLVELRLRGPLAAPTARAAAQHTARAAVLSDRKSVV